MSRAAALRMALTLSGLALAALIVWLAPLGGWADWALAAVVFVSDAAAANFVFNRLASQDEKAADLRERRDNRHL